MKMIDALYPENIPAGTTCDLIAAYVDHSANPQSFNQAVARFPDAQHVKITVTGVVGAHVLDCELSTLQPKPEQAVAWVVASRKAGYDPTVYCNELNTYDGLQPLKRAFAAAAVPEPHWWCANYDLDPTIPAGWVAKQYTDLDQNGQNTYDTSSTIAGWPNGDDMSQADVDAVNAHTDAGIGLLLRGDNPVPSTGNTHPHNLTQMDAKLDELTQAVNQLAAAVSKLQIGGIDPAAFAAAVASHIQVVAK